MRLIAILLAQLSLVSALPISVPHAAQNGADDKQAAWTPALRQRSEDASNIVYDVSMDQLPASADSSAAINPAVASVDSSAAPEDSSVASVDSSVAPIDSSAAPEDSSAASVDSSVAPIDPSAAPTDQSLQIDTHAVIDVSKTQDSPPQYAVGMTLTAGSSTPRLISQNTAVLQDGFLSVSMFLIGFPLGSSSNIQVNNQVGSLDNAVPILSVNLLTGAGADGGDLVWVTATIQTSVPDVALPRAPTPAFSGNFALDLNVELDSNDLQALSKAGATVALK